ncbi:hypothetical protein D1J63_32135 [Streptomyces sp. KPB2]|uniref:hypothetical protein n=1 Tax=unclassified Streptomyces TaxID=2593676 RepID=UPI000F716802|nr:MULTISPECIES: hypothetical protein [unclassified Streptomyces]AZM79082.1 hypothetical protein D1J63_32135 [Streptomyces sp. KPB2]MBH5132417.1 hypothetical protein [Streptomyces sp. HB-N217]
MYDDIFTVAPPADLTLSARLRKLKKAFSDASAAFQKYQRENDIYRSRNVTPYNHHSPRFIVPALVSAEKALQDAETAAVQAGKPLPDKDEFLGPVKAAVAEYERMTPALRRAVTLAQREFSEALYAELATVGRSEMDKATKAHQDYVKALEAAEEAKARLGHAVDNFSWVVSAGAIGRSVWKGWGDGNHNEAWEVLPNGLLSYAAAERLGFINYDLVNVPGLIEDKPTKDDSETVMTNVRTETVWNPGNYH